MAAVLVAAAAAYGMGVFGALSNGGFDDPASESAQAQQVQERVFPDTRADLVLTYHSDATPVTDPAFRAEVEEVLAGLPQDAVVAVRSPYAVPPQQAQASGLVSPDGHTARVVLTLAGSDETTTSDAAERVLAADLEAGPGDGVAIESRVGGQWAVFEDVNSTVGADIGRGPR